MRIKICGITRPDQGVSIVQLGATALGFICVPQSPRYVTPAQIRAIVDQISLEARQGIDFVGVFADADLTLLCETVMLAGLTAVQLHGQESPAFCRQLRAALPNVEMIKALRIRSPEALYEADRYIEEVDALLLDAYHPTLLGGTGNTIDWSSLEQFRPAKPWLLAGGLTPENVLDALKQVQPSGIDLSSGVEIEPGEKDLQKVAHLFAQLAQLQPLVSTSVESSLSSGQRKATRL